MKTHMESLIAQLNQLNNSSRLREKLSHLLLGFVCGLCLILVLGWQQTPAVAQITQAKIVEILDGNQVYIQNRIAGVNAVASVGKTVSTKQARTNILFNNNAGVRLGQNSALTVGSQCVQLRGGTVVVSGTRGCLGSITAVTRGTVYLIEMHKDGHSDIALLEGEIELTKEDRQNLEPVVLNPGEKIEINAEGILGTVEQLSQSEVEDILKGSLFNGFQVELPGMDQLRAALQDKFPDISLPSIPNIPEVNPPVRRPF